MTNKEYYIKNGISFADALKEYDEKQYPTVEKWFFSERKTNKFEVDDICYTLLDGQFAVIYEVDHEKNRYGIMKLYKTADGYKWYTMRYNIDAFDMKYSKIGTSKTLYT